MRKYQGKVVYLQSPPGKCCSGEYYVVLEDRSRLHVVSWGPVSETAKGLRDLDLADGWDVLAVYEPMDHEILGRADELLVFGAAAPEERVHSIDVYESADYTADLLYRCVPDDGEDEDDDDYLEIGVEPQPPKPSNGAAARITETPSAALIREMYHDDLFGPVVRPIVDQNPLFKAYCNAR